MDGNRTRRTGITHPTRFEGGGAHQALGHLRPATYRPTSPAGTPTSGMGTFLGMSKNRILLLVVLAALLAVLAKKVKDV